MLSGNTKSNGLLPWDILNAPNENKDVLVVPIPLGNTATF